MSDIKNYVDCCPDCHLSLSVLCVVVVVVAHVHSCCFSVIGVNDVVVMCLSVIHCNLQCL